MRSRELTEIRSHYMILLCRQTGHTSDHGAFRTRQEMEVTDFQTIMIGLLAASSVEVPVREGYQ